MMAGKFAGLGQKILGVPCWSEQKKFTAAGDAFDEFLVEDLYEELHAAAPRGR